MVCSVEKVGKLTVKYLNIYETRTKVTVNGAQTMLMMPTQRKRVFSF